MSTLADPELFKTRLTVATPQPARNATSFIVTVWRKLSLPMETFPIFSRQINFVQDKILNSFLLLKINSLNFFNYLVLKKNI
tara:strand:- start:1643 stop:1888 length:246 start_codon:yes stop_codon:yes gene_type:complete